MASDRPILWRPEQPVFWLFAGLTALCLPLQAVALVGLIESPGALMLGIAFGAIQLVLLWQIARWVAHDRPISFGLRTVALLWGFAVVPVIATPVNAVYFDVLNRLELSSFAASIAAPITEDTLRLVGVIGVLALLRASRGVTALDGVRFGLLVGAGFEIVENLSYPLGAEATTESIVLIATRLSLGFGLHVFWTATTGGVLAYCLMRPADWRRWFLMGPGLLVPMLLHSIWDAPALSVDLHVKIAVLIGVYAVSLGLCATVVLLTRRGARRPRC